MSRASALNDGIFRAEQRAAASLRNVSVLDLTDTFCDATSCAPTSNGIVVYRDDNHISTAYARSIAPLIASRVVSLIERSDEHENRSDRPNGNPARPKANGNPARPAQRGSL